MVCGSVNILDRLVSGLPLPDSFREKTVASVFDLYYRSLKKYDKLQDVFLNASNGADLILAVRRFACHLACSLESERGIARQGLGCFRGCVLRRTRGTPSWFQ